ncbi:MAG TPA: hypothetical protein PLB25_07145 [Rhodoferax sp.]|nr:hypothetical protein [Rhodoferax sp.]
MDQLKALESAGLVLPSPAYILGAIIFGLIGLIAFRRGRKATQPTLTWVGLALMLYPYVVPQTWLLWAIGAALSAWVFASWKA